MSSKLMYENLIAFHPGSYVEDIIEDLNITQKEFAAKLGTTEKSLSKLVNGEDNLSSEMAHKLSKLTGISINTWMNIQNKYDQKVLEINDRKTEDEAKICKLIDFKYFKDNGFVENKKYSLKEKIEQIRAILKVSNLVMLRGFNTSVSYRNTKDFDEKAIVNSNVMLEIATGIARNQCDTKLDKAKLKKYLPEIKQMTLQSPGEFYKRLKSILLECGIVLVALPNLPNASINGAVKKFRNGSIMLLISDKNKGADIFWFSIMHEIAHILNGDFSSDLADKDLYEKKELKADESARDFFIEKSQYDAFVNNGDFSRAAIINISNQWMIHPCILLGRLQKEKLVNYTYCHDLKIKYKVTIN